jgi:hypothetical protein
LVQKLGQLRFECWRQNFKHKWHLLICFKLNFWIKVLEVVC